jgi:uncharacterized protein (TIGR02147 family)
MSIFSYIDYRTYLKETLKAKPKSGYGEMSKWAASCQIHGALMSLILKGERELSIEQAFSLGKYLQLTLLELEYFIQLVQLERAATSDFKKHIQDKLNQLKNEATKVKKRFQHESELSEEARLIFYSSFLYSAIRLFCDIEKEGVSIDQIISKFKMTRAEVIPKLDFLNQVGLIVENKGKYKMGPARTLVSRDSLHVLKHHQNWRLQALLRAESLTNDELMFTCPMVLSKNDFVKFKNELTDLIQKFSSMLKDSNSEDIGCFNMDWIWINSN